MRPSRSSLGRGAVALLFATLVTGLGAGRAAAQPPADQLPLPTAVATRISTPIVLDGDLNDPGWRQAKPIGPLHQVDPHENTPATDATVVKIVYTSDTLYFGIHCAEPPDQIVAKQLQRDGNLHADDRIVIALDPFFDHRNGFFFKVNPVGARADGQINDNSHFLNQDWEGIWNAAARITADGWNVEIAIPFKTLRFKPGAHLWGLNIERNIQYLNETDRWAAPFHNSWVGNLAQAGTLSGLGGLHQGLGLDVRPYVSGGLTAHHGAKDVGLDVFKNITPNLNAALTINTDFAQTEADTRQVNLTPYSLFFPEKRAFFLEGSGVFNIPGLGFGGGPGFHGVPDLIPFFSRQIGLSTNSVTGDTQQVPILAGTKLTGRQGAYNIGVLDVQTRQAPDGSIGGQNLFVARVNRNLLQQSSVGLIVTHGNPNGGGNTLFGGDAKFATSHLFGNQNAILDVFAMRTQDQVLGGDNAFGFRLNYPNDLWNINVNWKQIGENFAPALGFVNRVGIRKINGGFGYQPRPKGSFIRQVFFEIHGGYITDLHNQALNWRVSLSPLNIRTNAGDHFEFDVIPQYERLTDPFNIFGTITLPVGTYQWLREHFQVNTADRRPWVINFFWERGGFYDGTNRTLSLGLRLKPSSHIYVEATITRNDVVLKEGRFYTQILTLNTSLNLSPNVSWANLVQYDNDSRELGIQSRFHWILKPGNDFYFVVDRGWYKTLEGIYQPNLDQVTLKLQYTFRF